MKYCEFWFSKSKRKLIKLKKITEGIEYKMLLSSLTDISYSSADLKIAPLYIKMHEVFFWNIKHKALSVAKYSLLEEKNAWEKSGFSHEFIVRKQTYLPRALEGEDNKNLDIL